jgi:putative SOS response-associated peptidase YedK
MCNRYGYLAPVTRLIDMFSEIGIPLKFRDGAIPNKEPREHIRPTNLAPIVRPLDPARPRAGVTVSEARRGLVPYFHKKPAKDWTMLDANARAESVSSTGMFRGAYARRRCLVRPRTSSGGLARRARRSCGGSRARPATCS